MLTSLSGSLPALQKAASILTRGANAIGNNIVRQHGDKDSSSNNNNKTNVSSTSGGVVSLRSSSEGARAARDAATTSLSLLLRTPEATSYLREFLEARPAVLDREESEPARQSGADVLAFVHDALAFRSLAGRPDELRVEAPRLYERWFRSREGPEFVSRITSARVTKSMILPHADMFSEAERDAVEVLRRDHLSEFLASDAYRRMRVDIGPVLDQHASASLHDVLRDPKRLKALYDFLELDRPKDLPTLKFCLQLRNVYAPLLAQALVPVGGGGHVDAKARAVAQASAAPQRAVHLKAILDIGRRLMQEFLKRDALPLGISGATAAKAKTLLAELTTKLELAQAQLETNKQNAGVVAQVGGGSNPLPTNGVNSAGGLSDTLQLLEDVVKGLSAVFPKCEGEAWFYLERIALVELIKSDFRLSYQNLVSTEKDVYDQAVMVWRLAPGVVRRRTETEEPMLARAEDDDFRFKAPTGSSEAHHALVLDSHCDVQQKHDAVDDSGALVTSSARGYRFHSSFRKRTRRSEKWPTIEAGVKSGDIFRMDKAAPYFVGSTSSDYFAVSASREKMTRGGFNAADSLANTEIHAHVFPLGLGTDLTPSDSSLAEAVAREVVTTTASSGMHFFVVPCRRSGHTHCRADLSCECLYGAVSTKYVRRPVSLGEVQLVLPPTLTPSPQHSTTGLVHHASSGSDAGTTALARAPPSRSSSFSSQHDQPGVKSPPLAALEETSVPEIAPLASSSASLPPPALEIELSGPTSSLPPPPNPTVLSPPPAPVPETPAYLEYQVTLTKPASADASAGVGLKFEPSRTSVGGLAVAQFVQMSENQPSVAEACGKIEIGDALISVNSLPVHGRRLEDVVAQIRAPRPDNAVTLRLSRGLFAEHCAELVRKKQQRLQGDDLVNSTRLISPVHARDVAGSGASPRLGPESESSSEDARTQAFEATCSARVPEAMAIVSRRPCFEAMAETLREAQQAFGNDAAYAGFDVRWANARMTGLRCASTSFVDVERDLFASVSVPLVVDTIAALLLERRVLLVSDRPAALTPAFLALEYLMHPFSWCHEWCPLLPESQLDWFASRVGGSSTAVASQATSSSTSSALNHLPFFAGYCTVDLAPYENETVMRRQGKKPISREEPWSCREHDSTRPSERLSTPGQTRPVLASLLTSSGAETMILDLDSDHVVRPAGSTRSASFPPEVRERLIDDLRFALGRGGDVSPMEEEDRCDPRETALRCRVAMLRAYAFLVGDVPDWTISVRRDVVAFPRKAFLEKHLRDDHVSPEHNEFLSKFTLTSCFKDFCGAGWLLERPMQDDDDEEDESNA